jgi:hypothetical protein
MSAQGNTHASYGTGGQPVKARRGDASKNTSPNVCSLVDLAAGGPNHAGANFPVKISQLRINHADSQYTSPSLAQAQKGSPLSTDR